MRRLLSTPMSSRHTIPYRRVSDRIDRVDDPKPRSDPWPLGNWQARLLAERADRWPAKITLTAPSRQNDAPGSIVLNAENQWAVIVALLQLRMRQSRTL